MYTRICVKFDLAKMMSSNISTLSHWNCSWVFTMGIYDYHGEFQRPCQSSFDFFHRDLLLNVIFRTVVSIGSETKSFAIIGEIQIHDYEIFEQKSKVQTYFLIITLIILNYQAWVVLLCWYAWVSIIFLLNAFLSSRLYLFLKQKPSTTKFCMWWNYFSFSGRCIFSIGYHGHQKTS